MQGCASRAERHTDIDIEGVTQESWRGAAGLSIPTDIPSPTDGRHAVRRILVQESTSSQRVKPPFQHCSVPLLNYCMDKRTLYLGIIAAPGGE